MPSWTEMDLSWISAQQVAPAQNGGLWGNLLDWITSRGTAGSAIVAAIVALERDDFSLSRHPALPLCFSMIFSENRRHFSGSCFRAVLPREGGGAYPASGRQEGDPTASGSWAIYGSACQCAGGRGVPRNHVIPRRCA